jgi:hypothetical protein
MRLRSINLWTGVFALLVSTAAAADITGTWQGERQGRNNQTMKVVLDLKAEGSTLTGTMSSFGDRQIPISDGKISGDDISFTVTIEFNDNKMKFLYTGKVSGNEMKLKSTREGSDRTTEFTVKKI